eukprot:TRINITY_DN11260_c0_g1_i1.p1 TRINITY_DN11260_c0_g1~~TRINITY_DN11260_c0_g1_i1.p1  ORF type:complete len:224 (+),score=27.14 TRINITY_DN11260_c0_g1_i1:24-695(+)
MIRKREDDTVECQHQCKRIRVNPSSSTNNVENPIEGVIHRALSWLLNLPESSRPKTYSSLTNAIERIASSEYTVDVNVIYFHLILNGIILVMSDDNSSSFVCVNPQPPGTGSYVVAVPSESSTRLSSDFKSTLNKAVAWVQNNRGLQGKKLSVETFLRSLSQVCRIRIQVEPSEVLNYFFVRGMIREEHGRILYDLLPAFKRNFMAYAIEDRVPTDTDQMIVD